MKNFKSICIVFLFIFMSRGTYAQNVMINILSQEGGIVKKGERLFIEVSIVNTNSKEFVDVYKLKVKITVPKEIVSIDSVGRILPTGWKILNNDGISITMTNGMDMIAARDNRKILIPIKAENVGGFSTIAGNLSFSNGVAPGIEPGELKNDLLGDNNSTTSCKVID